jgi:hypothetical protein
MKFVLLKRHMRTLMSIVTYIIVITYKHDLNKTKLNKIRWPNNNVGGHPPQGYELIQFHFWGIS